MKTNTIDSVILNFLSSDISFIITDPLNKSSTGFDTLKAKESTLLKVFNREYDFKVTSFKGKTTDILFKLVPSPSLAFMEDSSTNQIFILDLKSQRKFESNSGNRTLISSGNVAGIQTPGINLTQSGHRIQSGVNPPNFPSSLSGSTINSYTTDKKPTLYQHLNTNVLPYYPPNIFNSNFTSMNYKPGTNITILDTKTYVERDKPWTSVLPSVNPITPINPIDNPLARETKVIEPPKEKEITNVLQNFGDLRRLLKNAFETEQKEANFDLSKTHKEVFDKRLSAYFQLHRNNIDDPTLENLLPEKDEIKIINRSDDTLFLRLSGRVDKNKEYWTSVEPGHFHLFDREKNTIYKLHINNTESKDGGFVYIVKSGVVYQIDQNNNLIDLSQSHVCSISNNFHPLFEVVYGVFYNKDDFSMYKKSTQKKIIIINRSNTKTYMVNVAEDEVGAHDFIEIDPHLFVIFKRNALKTTATVTKKGDDLYLQKYNLETEYVYEFEDDSDDLMDISQHVQKPAEKIPYNCDEVKLNNYLTSNHEKKNLRRKNWEQIRTYSALSDKRKKIKDFSMLLFSSITFHNESNENIFVRVLPKKIGTESFQEVAPGEKVKFKRIAGFYPAEICTFEAKPFAIFVKSDNIYSYKSPDDCKEHQKKKHVQKGANEENIHDADSYVIKPVKKMNSQEFTVDSLVYFDYVEGVLKAKELIYPENNNSEIIEFQTENADDKNTDPKLEDEPEKGKEKPVEGEEEEEEEEEDEEEDEEEYYLDIKPNYIPGKPFIDPMFPPDDTSIKGFDPKTKQRRKPHFFHNNPDNIEAQMHPSIKRKYNNLKFMRPNEIWKKKYDLFKDGTHYENITQGNSGNRYLISIITSLSKRPDLIRNLFKTQTANPDGFYEIYYYEDGKKKIMFVDDYIPTYEGQLYYAKPKGEELWAILLEKAFAKYEGGYALIDGGQMYKEFSFFTGAMGRFIKCSTPNLWNEITTALNSNFFVNAISLSDKNDLGKTPLGIFYGQAYTILEAKEYRDDENVIRLLRIRNPCANSEFNGDFSYGSDKWTPKLKKYFGYDESQNRVECIFFMPYSIFLTQYTAIVICCLDTGISRR